MTLIRPTLSSTAAAQAELFKPTVVGVSDPPTAIELGITLDADQTRCLATSGANVYWCYRFGATIFYTQVEGIAAGGA